jgi:hypothetical protein
VLELPDEPELPDPELEALEPEELEPEPADTVVPGLVEASETIVPAAGASSRVSPRVS